MLNLIKASDVSRLEIIPTSSVHNLLSLKSNSFILLFSIKQSAKDAAALPLIALPETFNLTKFAKTLFLYKIYLI